MRCYDGVNRFQLVRHSLPGDVVRFESPNKIALVAKDADVLLNVLLNGTDGDKRVEATASAFTLSRFN